MYSKRESNLRKKEQRKRNRRFLVIFICAFISGLLSGSFVFNKQTIIKAERYAEVSDSTEEVGEIIKKEDLNTSKPKEEDWKLVLVNQNHPIENGYEPQLVEVENNYFFDARAVGALQQMLKDGRNEGLNFWICSAYRTIDKQMKLFQSQISQLIAEGMSYEQAYEEAITSVAYPGTSEHHLGLAVDIVAKDYQLLNEKQAETPEARWLKENCWKYGFILRYPVDKTEKTGIIFEPWHYRYVGVEAAKEIMEKGICLEEYLGVA